jgi:hypothetical protein
VRIFFQNLGDTAAVAASSANINLPATNVQNEARAKVWRTGATVAAETITFDLGLATALTSAILLAHTLTNADTLIQLRGSTDNFAASNTLVATFTWASGPLVVTFGSASFRYWRIAFTKSSSAQTRDIGRIFLGNYYQAAGVDMPDFDGYTDGRQARDISARSDGGQFLTLQRPPPRTRSLVFTNCTQTHKSQLDAIEVLLGTAHPWFLQVDENGPPEMAEALYGRFSDFISAQVTGFDNTASLWTLTLPFIEDL